ncbi:hypothetical protein Afil01_58690 [Actinorhabdospora filicis]|uniref:SGNH hydrolase-type esterase domain-containing protein n=1 Tax=Actinorhabdospora filicis TaxID=1785913 RepID=A0A9W6SSK4_9ACTN|nr:SGNH/GDSL hydrolase family protein [Actinorhabdospora filicis]GLZ81062.1 hypothetical protein Afil01_58690 [Actinorhabdospora filicis]
MNPLVAAQGLWVRARTEKLPEAAGPRTGVTGEGAPLRLAVLGDSTAAGCGVDDHENGFTGALAAALAARGHRVEWSVTGANGATSRRVRHRLLPEVPPATIAVLLAGTNDVLARRPPGDWREDLSAIVDGLPAERVAVVGLPLFAEFPRLPRALGRYLARRAEGLDAVAREVCAARPNAQWIPSAESFPVPPGFFARDGFHPSAAGYRHWARLVAGHLT